MWEIDAGVILSIVIFKVCKICIIIFRPLILHHLNVIGNASKNNSNILTMSSNIVMFSGLHLIQWQFNLI